MNAREGLSNFSSPPASAATQLQIGLRVHSDLPWLLLPNGVPSQIALDPLLAPVPNVKPWLRGVLNLRGNLVPVFDIACICGLALTDVKSSTVLVIEPGNNPIGVLCIEPPRIAVGSPAPSAVPPLALQALSNFLIKPMRSEHGVGYEFRFREWIASAGRLLPGSGLSAAPS